MARPTASTSAVDARLRSTLAATWPLSSAVPRTSIDRSRSMTPPAMSELTLTAVVAEPNVAQSRITPGTT